MRARALIASTAALAAVLVAVACGTSEFPVSDDGTSDRSNDDACRTPSEGCACEGEGTQVDCGKVTQQTGTFVECAYGKRTCVGGRWGACAADEFATQTKSLVSGVSPLGLAQDAGACSGNPCDPYCSSYSDTPPGLQFAADAGLRVTDAGLTLTPEVPAGASCTSITIAASATTMTVSQLSPLTSAPSSIVITPTFLPEGCATRGTQPTWVLDKPTVATIDGTGNFTMADGVAGPIVVRAFFATTASVLPSNSITIDVNVRATVTASVPPNRVAPSAQIDKFFTNASRTTPATPTATANVDWLYPYVDTWFPLGLLAPVIQYKVPSNPGNTAKVSLRYPVGAPASSATFDYSFFVGEQSNFYPNPANFSGSPAADTRDGQVVIPQNAWRVFEQTAKGNDAELIVQRWDSSKLQQESRLRIHLVDGQMKGTVYYASYNSPLAGNTGSILAIRPGASAPVVAVQNGGRCTVCHSLNSKGQYLIANGSPSSTYDASRRYDTSDNGSVVQDYTGSNGNKFAYGGAFPDGSFYMSHYGDSNWHQNSETSRLYKTSNAATISLTNWPSNMNAVTPTFSSDGTKLAFAFWSGSKIQNKGPSAAKGRLVVADFKCGAVNGSCTQASNWSVENARDVTPSNSATVGWPSFLPDGNSILYQRLINASNATGGWAPNEIATIAGGMNEIWMSTVPASTSTTAKMRRLDALNGYSSSGTSYLPTSPRDVTPLRPNYHGTNVTVQWKTDGCSGPYTTNNVNDAQLNYLPRVAPKEAGGVYWVVFSSRRMYGNVAWDNPWASQGSGCRSTEVPTQKLWVAAIDRNWNGTGDPSHPAFYLPGQELLAGNNKGYWVDSPCGTAGASCDAPEDCCQAPAAQVCRVVPNSTPVARRCEAASSCVGSGFSCTVDSECCGNGARCLGATSTIPGVCSLNQSFSRATYTRDYTATCLNGTKPVWQFFRWQSIVPAGTSIDFKAQTAAALPDGTTAPWGAMVPVGTANATTTGWASGPNTVDQALKAVGESSQERLRITMTFEANGNSEAPVLTQWEQLFDCVPAE